MTVNKIMILIIIEIVFIGLFFLYQPNCEPCLANTPCPSCISKEQIYILSIGIVNFGYINIKVLKNNFTI